MKIALDVMGGDNAPREIVAGALGALDQGFVDPGDLVLLGEETLIRDELAALEASQELAIVHAPEIIGMDENPAQALRRKNSSIFIGARMLREKQVGALVSAGNTGAMVAAATLLVKLLPGVRRPGISVTFGTAGGPCTLIDVGANIHCQPEDLYTYGEMASEYMARVFGLDSPRIALLNIGEEDAKGSPLVKQTRELFGASSLNFIGNVEGQQLFTGKCDVVVCEGFVGNVVLKVSEGLGEFIYNLFARDAAEQAQDTGGTVRHEMARMVRANTDYAEYGGAPLLGVDGSVIICHGRSDRRAIANALKTSRQFMDAKVNQHIVEGLAEGPELGVATDDGGSASRGDS